MNSGLIGGILALPSIIGFKPTYLIEMSGKWLGVVQNQRKIKPKPISTRPSTIQSSPILKLKNLDDPIVIILTQYSFHTP